jgi:poly(A) polymerase
MSAGDRQREFAIQIVRKLRDARHEAYWAGGSVRDLLLGAKPKDFDIATSARPDQVRELFGRRQTLAIGAAFGVIGVLGGREPIEVATFRTDGPYADGRHPDSVIYSDAQHDASRRDFTVNGLLYDPIEDRVIDYVQGQDDLDGKIIRAIGDPRARFGEDKLRMLRAVRFATTLAFDIEPQTLAAITEMAAEIDQISAERIGMELGKILVHPRRSLGLRLLAKTGLIGPLLPELAPHARALDDTWQRTLDCLDRLESDAPALTLAALLLSVEAPDRVRAIGWRFRYPKKCSERAAWLIESLPRIAQADRSRWPSLQRLLVHDGAGALMTLAGAVLGDDHPGLKHCRERLGWAAERLNPEPLVSGDDLIAHGIRPGPLFAQMLDAIRDAQLDERISDRGQALELARQWVEKHGTGV